MTDFEAKDYSLFDKGASTIESSKEKLNTMLQNANTELSNIYNNNLLSGKAADIKPGNCMEIKRHKVENRWIYGEYDFYIDGVLVAQLRRQLIGMDYAYLYFLPDLYRDNDRTRIDIRYMVDSEVIEKAFRIITKKLYTMSMKVLDGIKEISSVEGYERW